MRPISLRKYMRWNGTAGPENIGRFDMPQAERFARCFCPLDNFPAIQADARIFWASRASWGQPADNLRSSMNTRPSQTALVTRSAIRRIARLVTALIV
jgi:hypothetical protein